MTPNMSAAFYTVLVPLAAASILFMAAEFFGLSDFAQGAFTAAGFLIFQDYANDVWAGRAE